MNRRDFLKDSAGASIGATVAAVAAGLHVGTAFASSPAQPDAPDAGGFMRPRGWGVTLGAHHWADNGDWVVDRVLEALQPDHWHSWGIWPVSRTDKRIPAVFSDRWHDWSAGRQYLREHPKCEWLSWNEPDMPLTYMSPNLAAELTMRFVDEARAIDNDFQITSPGITLNTNSLGLRWLTDYMKIMRTKNMMFRFSSWNVHPYTCNTVDRLRQSMALWWEWWQVWGSGAPTLISELCAENAPVDVQIEVMNEARRMLDDREVLGVSWCSAYQNANDGVPWEHYHMGILNPNTRTYTLTPLGQHWKELQAA